MALKKYNVRESDVIEVPLPQATETYVPVPNKTIIQQIRQRAQDEGFRVYGSGYMGTNQLKVVTGVTMIGREEKPGPLNLSVNFTNSYDKTRKLSIGLMGLVLACSNGMVTERQFAGGSHMHTGKVIDQLTKLLDKIFAGADKYLNNLEESRQKMMETRVDMELVHKLAGKFYMEERLLNTLQLEMLRRNLHTDKNWALDPKEPRTFNVWNVYNQFTELLKYNPPGEYSGGHLKVHNQILSEMGWTNVGGVIRQIEPVEEAEVTDG